MQITTTNEQEYIEQLAAKLFDKNNRRKIAFSKEWLAEIPSKAGVYVFTSGEEVVYVGETGNLRKRMKDLFDSRNHTLRRTVGERFYSHVEGFCKATVKIKFPAHIEELVNVHLCKKYKVSFLEVSLGRKELEEYIESLIKADLRLNKRGKRI